MNGMNWSGDALRRFNGALITSIEKKNGEQDDFIFSDYVINYTCNGIQKFVELRSLYIQEYKSKDMCFTFLKAESGESEEYLLKSKEAFMKNLLDLIEWSILEGKPVNLVIEALHKGAIVHFLRKIEFP